MGGGVGKFLSLFLFFICIHEIFSFRREERMGRRREGKRDIQVSVHIGAVGWVVFWGFGFCTLYVSIVRLTD